MKRLHVWLPDSYLFSPECMRRSLFISLSVFLGTLVAGDARAIPLARYDRAVEMQCGKDELCALSIRGEGTLGSYTGVSVNRSAAASGKIATTVTKGSGRLQLDTAGTGLVSLLLSWDGDPNPRQLSSAGLGCFNLRAFQGVALVISDFSVSTDCEKKDESSEAEEGCSELIIETRLYDATDPTGQIYSWSSVRRSLSASGTKSLVIPFSNFLYHAPRGTARFTCAGAITLSLKLAGSTKMRVEMGPAYIDDHYGLAVAPTVPPTPTPAARVAASPTALVEVVETALPVASSQEGAMGAASSEVATDEPKELVPVQVTGIPAVSETPSPRMAPTASKDPAVATDSADDGAVFGSVVAP